VKKHCVPQKATSKIIGVGAGTVLGCKGYFAQIFPKKLYATSFRSTNSVAVDTLYFPLPSFHKLENGKGGT